MAKIPRKTTARAASSPKSKGEAKRRAHDTLATYRAKRNFKITPEPSPESSQAAEAKEKKSAKPAKVDASTSTLEFVVQKHDATRMHYDVRIEINGAMMSWAVPKGPSYDPNVKRLAVETEDHPMAYNRFEGRIPDGEYGAGDVLIWDRGTYETVPPGQEEAMRAKGHVHLRFFGDKLEGEWHFVRTKGSANGSSTKHGGGGETSKAAWLMFKAKDRYADPKRDIIAERPESLVSGRSATRGPRRVGASPAGKSASTLLASVGETARAKSVPRIDDPSRFLFEIKYDGYRILAAKAGTEIALSTRNGNDWTKRFDPIARAIAALPLREAVIDGEACVTDENGIPSFGRLQEWLSSPRPSQGALSYIAFDLLWTDGRDLRALPIEERRELLHSLLAKAPAPITLAAAIEGNFAEIVSVAKRSGLEGLIAKRKGSAYVGGANGDWLKIKFAKRQDVALVGYVPLAGSREPGAFLTALVDENAKGEFRFAGRVAGFNGSTGKKIARVLEENKTDDPKINGAPKIKGAVWSSPTLVAEIALTEWSREGLARHPRFLGLREDKSPRECMIETGRAFDASESRGTRMAHASQATSTSRTKPPSKISSTKIPSAAIASTKITNATKVLFPRDGINKKDVVAYYEQIAPTMLPHLHGRPLALQRWPNGIDSEDWYQQNAPPNCPPFVRLVRVHKKDRIVVENAETLGWLANLAALTLHQWSAHVVDSAKTEDAAEASLLLPDYCVIDLDPGDGTWKDLVDAAEAVRALLEALEMPSAVKTSGKRGIHIVVPFKRGPSHEESTAFGEQVARAVSKALPKITTDERMKAKRGGRLYVDFLQNGWGKTIVAPYTIRAKDGATVSTPITWSEVTTKLDPSKFTIRNVLERVAKHGDLFAEALVQKHPLPNTSKS